MGENNGKNHHPKAFPLFYLLFCHDDLLTKNEAATHFSRIS